MMADQQSPPKQTCDVCRRSFARNEHLTRHRRIHTGERPFKCLRCNIAFQRKDVQARHMRRCHPEVMSEAQPLIQRPDRTPKSRYPQRSRLACDNCRKQKLKCSDTRPCESCRFKLLECTISSSSRPPGRPRNNAPLDVTSLLALEPPLVEEGFISSSPGPGHSSLECPDVSPRATECADEDLTTPETAVFPCDTSTAFSSNINHHNTVGIASRSEIASTPPGDVLTINGNSSGEMDILQDILHEPFLGTWFNGLSDFSSLDEVWGIGNSDLRDGTIPAMLPDGVKPAMRPALGLMSDYMEKPSESGSSRSEEYKWLWYSAAPQLYIYDEEVINILLNLARKHISSTFSIFSDFEAKEDTQVELCLAMASVGGLYCRVPGSTEVAKKLFHDARRLLLDKYLQTSSQSFNLLLSFAKTFILLELYGLCSGNKRAFEFYEAFHATKLHAVSCCLNVLLIDGLSTQFQQFELLKEAITILDSYRVLLLQRSPSLPTEMGFDFHSQQGFSAVNISPFSTTTGHLSTSNFPTATLHQLASIVRHVGIANFHDLNTSSWISLYKPEFIELALDRWIQAKCVADEAPSTALPEMLLFHLAHVSLHSNLQRLHVVAQQWGDTCRPEMNTEGLQWAQAWKDSCHFEIAHWHSKTIIQLVQEALRPIRCRGQIGQPRADFIQPPHIPLCIYFATLVLWAEQVLSGSLSSSAQESLELGSQLLFDLSVPLSRQLGTVLIALNYGQDVARGTKQQ